MRIKILFATLIIITFSSCGTLLGGPITDCQKHKPGPGEPKRKLRIWALIFDGPWGWYIDFRDGAIYKPCAIKTDPKVEDLMKQGILK